MCGFEWEGSGVPPSFLLCPVGGAAAVLREVPSVPGKCRAGDSGCGRDWRLKEGPGNKEG